MTSHPMRKSFRICFQSRYSSISCQSDGAQYRITLSARAMHDVKSFITRLPQDWIFASYEDTQVTHQVREQLMWLGVAGRNVRQVAERLYMSSRTLCRKLKAEHTSFIRVRDDLRRDFAIERLSNSSASMSEIAQSWVLAKCHLSIAHSAAGSAPRWARSRVNRD